jgi:oligoendopeptidase F
METQTGIIERNEISEESKWDLSDLFESDSQWESFLSDFEKEISGYEVYKGTLADSALAIKNCLEFDATLSRKMDSLYCYAHLKKDEDKTNSKYLGNFDKTFRIYSELGKAQSFIAPELTAISQDKIDEYLSDPILDFYKLKLDRILRYKEHTLSDKEESLLAASMEMSQSSRDTFGMLNNADLELGTVQDKEGNKISITHGNLQSLMQSYDRDLRKNSFHTFYSAYEKHQYTFASLLSSSVKKDIFYSKSRNYNSVREQALFSENIPVEVYDNLIDSVHKNLKPLYKYFNLRKKILSLDELHIYDCSVPLAKNLTWKMNYDEAVETIRKALQPLGEEYINTVSEGISHGRWVDRYENKGKQNGAYSSGCFDSRPYILLNYKNEDINSLYTLAHEAGHSMHSYYSRKSQPYIYSGYTIFVAEVASTFNEALITRQLLSQNTDRDMKIYLICREIDNFRGTLYRQTMFAEFERDVYAMAERGDPLTVESFRAAYQKLLETYFGDETTLDEILQLECFRIPHFYFSFYVYKYATGISAAYTLAERVLKGDKNELNDYLAFLNSGGTKYPIDQLKDAGVDMTSSKPIDKSLETFSALVDQLEKLVA